ncbi:MAG: GNAT family N-acetyltransferase [Christensenellales bacterium]
MLKRPDDNQYRQTVKLLNKVFKQKFEKTLPKIYGDNDSRDSHIIAVENDVIVGALADIKMNLSCYENNIYAAGIGMVATRPGYRGKGVMKSLLDKAIEQDKKDGVQVMFLSGYLRRYDRFGFYPSGVENVYTLRADKDYIPFAGQYDFEELSADNKNIELLQAQYNKLQIRWERNKFYDTLTTWKSKPYVVKKQGHVLGYLVKNRYGSDISEIVVEPNEIVGVLTAWIKKRKVENIKVSISPYNGQANKELIKHSESYCQNNAENWLILDFVGVIKALLSAKIKQEKVLPGQAVVSIDGENIFIGTDSQCVSVERSDKKADVELSREQATRLFFGVKTNVCDNQWLNSILPLPLCVPAIDRV